ncbi:thiol-activated cytolysin family protein [Flagellimonas lutaonensis]|uniref:Thiol-activated cytolysin n=1 Tax=Flagellimonas lutaonensis TaxID=516051 RepID=A0A0D5YX30_9FLAO|nr:thiol-activated cytolysin family protein [Allomuricauda lutaonensis]AKA36408.1 hypothetical protein VC82_2862 [Allomuricauda lutaonensis]
MKSNQSFFRITLYVSVLCLLLVACSSCSKDEVEPGAEQPNFSNNDALDFNAAVANLSAFNQPNESPIAETNSTEPERDSENTTLECFTKTYEGAPGFNELFTLDPTTDVIYPGAMLKGETIPTGEYSRINADRSPITMSISLSNIDGSPSVTIDNPNNLSEVRQGINELLNREVTGATPAQLVVEESQVYSEQQLAIALGANYRDKTKDISGSFDFNSTTIKKKYVLKFIQKYFTLDLDSPGKSPSDLFTSLPSIESLGATNPVYVSSVTYGRMVLYTIESESSISEIKSAFDAAIDAGKREGDFELDVDSKEILEKSSIKAIIIGGSGASAAQTIGDDSLSKIYDFIAEGGNYSKDSPGAPLAYKLSYVKQGFPAARVVLATEYQVRNCDLAYPEYYAEILKITGSQLTDTEVFGKLRVKMWVGGERLDINNNGIDDGKTWDRKEEDFVEVRKTRSYTVKDHNYTFKPYRPNQAIDFIECSGELADYNGFLGSVSLGDAGGIKEIKLNTLKINEARLDTLKFTKGIQAHFRFTRLK